MPNRFDPERLRRFRNRIKSEHTGNPPKRPCTDAERARSYRVKLKAARGNALPTTSWDAGESPSTRAIFGIPRRCPDQPLTETFWDIKMCQTDNDCWPRVCCPDGENKYCRTSQPIFEESVNPAARQLAYPIEAISQYLQCTSPPPVIFDIHPKPCNSTLDCFPNLCCQESGKRYCRPPKRSLLAFVTDLTSRLNVGALKEITDNLVIRK